MSKYSVPVWTMILESFKSLDPQTFVTLADISLNVKRHFPNDNVNKMTLRLQTIFHCVNHPGTKHDSSKRYERNPLFYTDGKGKFRLLNNSEIMKYKKSS